MTHPNVAAAEDMQIAQEDQAGQPEPLELSLWDTLERTREAAEGARHMLARQYELPDEVYGATLNALEIKLLRNGRHYLFVFSPNPVSGCTLNMVGVVMTFNLAAGWNLINAPDGSLLSAPAGTSQVILLKRTNWPETAVGGVTSISASVGAPVALASGTPTQTNAGSETKISFASTANHWTMQNNSTANVYYTTDGTTASTSSLVLAPGAQVFYDWPLLTLHVFTAAATNINGATGIVIQGRA